MLRNANELFLKPVSKMVVVSGLGLGLTLTLMLGGKLPGKWPAATEKFFVF